MSKMTLPCIKTLNKTMMNKILDHARRSSHKLGNPSKTTSHTNQKSIRIS